MGCKSRVQTIRCWLCVHDQLSTRSVRLFLSKRSASWLRPVPTCATSVRSNAVTSCSVSRRKRITVSPASRPMPSTVIWKDLDAPVAPESRCTSFFPRRRDGVRCGHVTSFAWLPIQSLFHRGLVVRPNKCEGIRAKPTPRNTHDLGLPYSQGRVSIARRLREPCSEHVKNGNRSSHWHREPLPCQTTRECEGTIFRFALIRGSKVWSGVLL